MQQLLFQIHGGQDHDGLAASLAHLLAFIEGLVARGDDNGGGFLSLFFSGLASLDNIHPVLVHFPIAFLSGFFLMDTLGTLFKKTLWRSIASYLLYWGTFAAALTVLAGFSAADSVAHGDNVHEIMENHEHIGIAILVLASGLSLWRYLAGEIMTGVKNTGFLILATLLCVLIISGADLGGLMVYHYGVAVQAVPIPATGYTHQH